MNSSSPDLCTTGRHAEEVIKPFDSCVGAGIHQIEAGRPQLVAAGLEAAKTSGTGFKVHLLEN